MFSSNQLFTDFLIYFLTSTDCGAFTIMSLNVSTTFKKLSLAVALAMGFSYASSALASDTVKVFSYDGKRSETTVEVPVNPQRVVVIDYASLDIIDNLGVGNTVVGSSHGAGPEYLKKYQENKAVKNVGTVKEVDFEVLMELQPDVIFVGGRLAPKYEELSKIAPVVLLAVDYKKSLIESLERNTEVFASIFQKEHAADAKIASFKERIAKLQEKAKGKSAVIGMVNASQFRTLGDTGRCSMISRDIGFVNLAKDVEATHGNEASFELLLKLNPQYIFILDRDSAVGRKGAALARDVMNNELVNKTDAAKNNNITYLNSQVWT